MDSTHHLGKPEAPMTQSFLKLLQYRLIHTAEGVQLPSEQRESHMVKEQQCVREVTEDTLPWVPM